MLTRLKEKIKDNPRLKQFILNLIVHPVKTRPRRWIRFFQFIYLERGKSTVIYRSVRKDLPPFHKFKLGDFSVIEDFSCVNNSVGDILIGNHCRVGLGNTIIGPVILANGVILAQNVVLIGLDHNYQDIHQGIIEQGITTSPVCIGDHTVIGANSVVLSGTTIGKHCFIGAGSLVNKNIPDYSVAVGNPIRIIKQYDFEKQEWIKTNLQP